MVSDTLRSIASIAGQGSTIVVHYELGADLDRIGLRLEENLTPADIEARYFWKAHAIIDQSMLQARGVRAYYQSIS